MRRSLFHLPSQGSICPPCQHRLAQYSLLRPSNLTHARPITTTSHNRADDLPEKDINNIMPITTTSRNRTDDLPEKDINNIMPLGFSEPSRVRLSYRPPPRPHRLHIYATKHNCHITLAQGNRDALISVSSGNLGFKKAQRGTYDAAYQLGNFVIGRINNMGLLFPDYPGKGGTIKELEVVLRDYGPGREAVTKLLLGAEGKALRGRVSAIMDSTRLKFGGTRSPKPRRLG